MSNESDFDDLYGNKYYSVPDLHGETPHFRIGKIVPAELKEKDGSTKRRYLLYFEGVEKALVLNKTNAQKLAAAYGKDYSKWIGMEVELYAEMTGLGKEGVRVRPLKPTPASDLNDAINF
ncbi:hypothetical protein [Bradyrhizobium sp. McL0615]|uniref:hypothetical protein n=1 Tax=Bradyrhizobium sp. McL0615 TaxID=3415673 RepID=UPI003CFB2C9B